jgi:hypothetical protein
VAVTLVHGKHKSAALAERHLRQLERENPNTTVSIIARRSATGRFSLHGRFFTFKIEDTKPEKEVDSLEAFWKEYDKEEKRPEEEREYEPEEWEGRPSYGDET